jgi:hypothetical protein
MSRYPTVWRGVVRHRARDAARHPDGPVRFLLGREPLPRHSLVVADLPVDYPGPAAPALLPLSYDEFHLLTGGVL